MVFFSDVSPVVVNRDRSRAVTVRSRNAPRILSSGFRFTGVVFIIVAAGMWIVPAAVWDTEMMLIRFAVSLAFLCFGFLLIHAGGTNLWDEIHLDQQARELRLVRRGRDGIARLRQRIALDELDTVVIDEDTIIIHARSGEIVMEVSGLDRSMLKALEGGLMSKEH